MNKEIKVEETIISGWVPEDESAEDAVSCMGFENVIKDEFYDLMYLTKVEAKEDGIIKPIYRRFKVTVNIEVEDFDKKPSNDKKSHDH